MAKDIRWLKEPEALDYPAAKSYLDLVCGNAKPLVKALRTAEMTSFKAKDILRASRLSALGTENKHVDRDKKKIRSGEKLSPLLLVRDSRNHMVIVADGYHRLCAVYYYDEDADVPCKIVEGDL